MAMSDRSDRATSDRAMSDHATSDRAMSDRAMSDADGRDVAETLFERTREQIRDAMRLEEERRAALVKNLYRLRALRLSRDRKRLRAEEAPQQP